MTWWDRRLPSTRIVIVGLLIAVAVLGIVAGYNLGVADWSYIVPWFLRLYPYIIEGYAALTLLFGVMKGYFLLKRPEKGPAIEGKGAELKGPAVDAVIGAFVFVSQFVIATFLLSYLVQGQLVPVASFDEYGLLGLLAFLYITAGRGTTSLIVEVGERLVGPTEIPKEAREKGLVAKPVEGSAVAVTSVPTPTATAEHPK